VKPRCRCHYPWRQETEKWCFKKALKSRKRDQREFQEDIVAEEETKRAVDIIEQSPPLKDCNLPSGISFDEGDFLFDWES